MFSTVVIVFFWATVTMMLMLGDRGREEKGAREVSESSFMFAVLHVSRRKQGL